MKKKNEKIANSSKLSPVYGNNDLETASLFLKRNFDYDTLTRLTRNFLFTGSRRPKYFGTNHTINIERAEKQRLCKISGGK